MAELLGVGLLMGPVTREGSAKCPAQRLCNAESCDPGQSPATMVRGWRGRGTNRIRRNPNVWNDGGCIVFARPGRHAELRCNWRGAPTPSPPAHLSTCKSGRTCPKGFDVAPIVGAFLPRSGGKLSWFTGGAQQHQSSEEPAGRGRGSVAWAATVVRGWEAGQRSVDLGRRVGAKHTMIAVWLQPPESNVETKRALCEPHAPGAAPSPHPF